MYVLIYFFLGKEAGVWFLDLKNGKGATGKGEPSQPADATLTMDSGHFFEMFSGKCRSLLSLSLHKKLIYFNVYQREDA